MGLEPTRREAQFPFLFGGTFIEGRLPGCCSAAEPDFPSFSEGLSLREYKCRDEEGKTSHFPSFSEGLSLRVAQNNFSVFQNRFPFLFGGTFIEGESVASLNALAQDFPSFSEGLSLRARFAEHALTSQRRFPFLFGGTFIEAVR